MSTIEQLPQPAPMPEAIPIDAERYVLPIEIQQAVNAIRKRDTMDAYGQRLKGTTSLGARATLMAGLPSVFMGVATEGPEGIAFGGTASVLAGSVLTSAHYVYKRVKEKGRVIAAEHTQTAIRDYLDEPVDVIRNRARLKQMIRRPKRGRELSLRWYGADDPENLPDPEKLANTVTKLARFATQSGIDEVVVSAKVFIPLDEKGAAKPWEGDSLTHDDFFEKTKGTRIHEKHDNTPLLTRLSVQEAWQLAKRLDALVERHPEIVPKKITKVQAIGDWLTTLRPDHPIAEDFAHWKKRGLKPELKPTLAHMMRGSLNRHFNNATNGTSAKIPITNSQGLTTGYQRVGTSTLVNNGPAGVEIIRTAKTGSMNGQRRNNASSEFHSYESIVGGNVDKFIDDLLALKDKELLPSEHWKLELALYKLLLKEKDAVCPAGYEGLPTTAATTPTEAAERAKTLFERMVDEPPRTKFHTGLGLRRRGKVPKNEQTIRYGRMFWRNIAKKTGALATAAVLGAGIGNYWYDKWEYAEDVKINICSPPAPENVAYCESPTYRTLQAVDKSATAMQAANSWLETEGLLALYKTGVINPGNFNRLSAVVSDKWKAKKQADLQKRFNLYGGQETSFGDVENGGSNPGMWELTPINGAKTNGYWHQHVHDKLNLRYFQNIDEGTMPYGNVTLSLSNRQENTSVVEGTDINRYPTSVFQRYSELSIPTSINPNADSRQLIGVNGRVLTSAGEPIAVSELNQNGEYQSNTYFSYALPVLAGSDIIAAAAVFKDIGDDRIVGSPGTIVNGDPVPRIIQRDDGTFHLLLEDIEVNNNTLGIDVGYNYALDSYLDISYWVDPNATTETPVRAVKPIIVDNTALSTPQPQLDEILTEEDVAPLNAALGLQPGASAAATAGAVARSRKYSYEPYKEERAKNPDKATDIQLEVIYDSEVVLKTATYAESMDAANCNVAFMIGAVASRGKDGADGFINGVTGFNEDGDGVLSQMESHIWTVNDKGKFVDATPRTRSDASANDNRPPEAFYNPIESERNPLLLAAQIAGMAAALGAGMVAGNKLTPRQYAAYTRRRRASSLEWLEKPEQGVNLALLRQVVYGKPTSVINDRDLPATITNPPNQSGQERAKITPRVSNKKLRSLIAAKNKAGSRISPLTHHRLRRLVHHSRNAQ